MYFSWLKQIIQMQNTYQMLKLLVLLRCLGKKICLLYDVEQSPPYNVFGKLLHIITTWNELNTTTGNFGLGNFTLHFTSFKFKRLIPLKLWVLLERFWNKKTQVLYGKKNNINPQNNMVKPCRVHKIIQ
jgi:hypothetical protein